MITQKIGFIGCGNMSGAILRGALARGGLTPDLAWEYDISPAAMEAAKELGVNLAANNEELCANSDIILLGVKPQYTPDVLAECGKYMDGKAIMSIVAGITVERLKNMIDGNVRILRIMPNTPAMVFEGAFALCSDNDFTEEELAIAKSIYENLGIVEMIPEKLFDTICGTSGGGPAWVAMFIEAMGDAGVKNGLPRATAYRLAAQTCLGTAKLFLETGKHPGELKDMVTSPGGTTIEGCEALERGGFRHAIMDCVNVATEKSKRL